MVQWLGLHASTAGDTGWIPGQGAKITHDMWHSQKKKTQQNPKNEKKKNKQTKNTLNNEKVFCLCSKG